MFSTVSSTLFRCLLLVSPVAIFLFVRVIAGGAIRRFLRGRRSGGYQGLSYRERPPALCIAGIPEGRR